MIRRRKLGEEPKKVLSLNTTATATATNNNDSSLHPPSTTTKSLSLARPPPLTSTLFKHNNDSILSIKWIIWISIGIILRILLFQARFDLTLQKQVEFSTPTTSFRRVTEGLHLVTQLNQSPYNSTMFLQPPLILLPFLSFYQWSESSRREIGQVSQYDWFCRCLFIGMDVLITVLLFQIAKIHRTNVDLAHSFDSNEALLQSSSSLHGFHSNLPHVIAALYLFNPIMICSCVSMSTVIFNNLALAATVYFALKGNVVWCTMSVSLASYQNLFPLVLIVPITLMIQRAYAYEYYLKRRSSSDLKVKKNHSLLYSSSNHVVVVGIKVVLLFSFWFALWMYLSYVMTGYSWQFIENAYVYPMSVQDLTPNWSNFWYMFTEVFDHFRRFFLLIFHVHQFAYILPLTVRLKDDPTFLCLLMIGTLSVFKAYATFADSFFYVTLLMMYSYLTKYMRYGFFISVLMTYGVIIGPACFRTWIFKGTGNANFFYFVTLLFQLAQVLLVVEFVYAKLREKYEKKIRLANILTPSTPSTYSRQQ